MDEPRRRVDHVRVPLKARNPVAIVRDGVDAGIVSEPALNQGFSAQRDFPVIE